VDGGVKLVENRRFEIPLNSGTALAARGSTRDHGPIARTVSRPGTCTNLDRWGLKKEEGISIEPGKKKQ
jgi:hypothetical protein